MRPCLLLPSARAMLVGGALALSAACATDRPTAPPATPPANPPATPPAAPPSSVAAAIYAESGDGQLTPENEPVRLAVTVRVVNDQGRGLAGKRVSVAVVEGGGSLADTVGTTDSEGRVVLPQWSIGSGDAPQRLRVRADSVEVTLSAYPYRRPTTPIGGRVILVRGDSVLVSNGTSGSEQLLRVFPSYYGIGATSPDDGLVSLLDRRDDSICVAALLSDTLRCTSVTSHGNLYAFTWSADQQQLYFVGPRKERCGSRNCYFYPVETLALSVATMTVARVSLAGSQGKFPHWSPDGRSVAFTTVNGTLMLMDADGSNARSIPMPGSFEVQDARWSPDGRRLALSLRFLERCPWLCDTGIGVIGIDGGGFRLLIEARTENEEYVDAPIWSPDGTRVGFELEQWVTAVDAYRTDVFVVPADGGAPGLLFPLASVLSWR